MVISQLCRSHVYRLGSLQFCRQAFCRLLGVGVDRLTRIRKGLPDGRLGKRCRGEGRQLQSLTFSKLYEFLWHVYTTQATSQPNAKQDIILDFANPCRPVPDSLKQCVRAYRQATEGADGFPTAVLEPTANLPRLELPPGSKRDYWWHYLACERTRSPTEKPLGSYRSLCRVWRECFSKLLKFGEYRRHPKCNECTRLKERMRLAASFADKVAAAELLQQHREKQWRDRLLYWRLRAEASEPGSPWLVIIIDGADQAKFRIMRMTEWPKDLASEHRPQMKVVGSWAHGQELSFAFCEEDIRGGSNVTVEVLVQQLDRLLHGWLHSPPAPGRGQHAIPKHFWVQVDNCGGDNKNVHLCKFMASLVDRGTFRSTVLSYLQVGHTHEDIDASFSIMCGSIKDLMTWDSPMEMAERVQRRMSNFMAIRLRPIPVCSGLIHRVRDWRSWLDPLDFIRGKRGVENITGAHWLAFVRRLDVPLHWATLQPAPAPGSAATNPNDVVLLAKQFMSDADLMQPPELMLRAGASAVLQPLAGPGTWDSREEIDVQAIRRLCRKVQRVCPSRASVVPYLEGWMAQPRVPAMPVPYPAILQHHYTDQHNCAALAHAMDAALQREARDVIRPLLVKRRRCTPADRELHDKVTLEQYVATRKSQGVQVHSAVEEWNGRQALLWSEGS